MDLHPSLALQGISLAEEGPLLFPGGGGGEGGMEMRRGRPSNSDQNNNINISAPASRGFSGSRSVRLSLSFRI